jgi:hydroxymethylpyrimidine pyrophosphatase-like HAD family hydrolase
MILHVLACDYDGTIADHGHVTRATAAALARVRASGRKIVLVTGRMLPDLRHVCPTVDEMFDAVVVENGAVLYHPNRREVKLLGAAPEPTIVAELKRRGVPLDIGSSILATLAPFAEECIAAIREAGVERTLVFNKGALMLLPGGVTKATGLDAALATLGYSPHNVAGIGDGENDHAFLSICEFAVAVGDAVPALKDRADLVTREPGSRGVARFIEDHVLSDAATLAPRIARHQLHVGDTAAGEPVRVRVHGTHLLVLGPSATGKSTLTGVVVERLVESGRSVCLLDPEGDYQSLSELEGVVVFGGKAAHALPTTEELDQLLRRPRSSLVLNLSAMTRTEKVEYGTKVLAGAAATRAAVGLPHWLVIDEAHHIVPADGSPAIEALRPARDPVCLITLSVNDLAPEVHALPNTVASTDLAAFDETLVTLASARGEAPQRAMLGTDPLERGEAGLAWLDDGQMLATRFRVARRRVEHRRHIRKYTEGELPPDRSFFFRGPDGALNLRAANLVRFCELAEGIDPATWEFHLRRGDYSRWLREMIKDPELAVEVHAIETNPSAAATDSRRDVLAAIRRRYAV